MSSVRVVDAAAPRLRREGSPVLPKAPVLEWRSFAGRGAALPCVADLPQRAYTTSGRAALLAALRQVAPPPGSSVLVASYHCPTMVAPILMAGLVPEYFPIDADGLPALDAIDAAAAGRARVMFVAHYFGLPGSLRAVRDWCRARDIVLVEDCAHCFFGRAGELPVGAWGDYATASLSKFYPVAEAGLLASAGRALRPLGLAPAGAKAQIKGVLDVIELAHRNRRLAGVSHLLSPLFWLKNGGAAAAAGSELEPAGADAETMMQRCDMARAGNRPSAAAIWLQHTLPVAGIVRARQANYLGFAARLRVAPGARPLFERSVENGAPYVFPLWIDDPVRADATYAAMRAARLPVFRWDHLWPGTPADPQDAGAQWSRQVLQLLCHQSLGAADVGWVADTTLKILQCH